MHMWVPFSWSQMTLEVKYGGCLDRYREGMSVVLPSTKRSVNWRQRCGIHIHRVHGLLRWCRGTRRVKLPAMYACWFIVSLHIAGSIEHYITSTDRMIGEWLTGKDLADGGRSLMHALFRNFGRWKRKIWVWIAGAIAGIRTRQYPNTKSKASLLHHPVWCNEVRTELTLTSWSLRA